MGVGGLADRISSTRATNSASTKRWAVVKRPVKARPNSASFSLRRPLARLANFRESVSPWASWLIGIMLSWAVLYHGVPKVMEPDPSHGFGLFLVTSIVLLIATGLTRLVTAWYLQGKLGELGPLSHLKL